MFGIGGREVAATACGNIGGTPSCSTVGDGHCARAVAGVGGFALLLNCDGPGEAARDQVVEAALPRSNALGAPGGSAAAAVAVNKPTLMSE